MTTVKNAAQQSVVKTMGNLHWTETLDQHQMSAVSV
ncbi:hypothetical protein TYRP_017898 [Tyrophagus putrescentiae]|nr:hypothetical protein TYRP_017898 [Tyrophagus putrescentiae]